MLECQFQITHCDRHALLDDPLYLVVKEILYLAAPKGLFPPEPEHYRGPKLKVAIIGAGLAGMSTAVELLDQGHEVHT